MLVCLCVYIYTYICPYTVMHLCILLLSVVGKGCDEERECEKGWRVRQFTKLFCLDVAQGRMNWAPNEKGWRVRIGWEILSRVFTNGPGDRCSFSGRVIPKTQKMVLDATLLNTKYYKVRIKGKVEQSRKWSSALSSTSV